MGLGRVGVNTVETGNVIGTAGGHVDTYAALKKLEVENKVLPGPTKDALLKTLDEHAAGKPWGKGEKKAFEAQLAAAEKADKGKI